MIRFLNLKDQICKGDNDFAFYDTVSDTICRFGSQGEQVFGSVREFKQAYNHPRTIQRPLERFLNLIPSNYFDEEDIRRVNKK